jgi:hypothetical protein
MWSITFSSITLSSMAKGFCYLEGRPLSFTSIEALRVLTLVKLDCLAPPDREPKAAQCETQPLNVGCSAHEETSQTECGSNRTSEALTSSGGMPGASYRIGLARCLALQYFRDLSLLPSTPYGDQTTDTILLLCKQIAPDQSNRYVQAVFQGSGVLYPTTGQSRHLIHSVQYRLSMSAGTPRFLNGSSAKARLRGKMHGFSLLRIHPSWMHHIRICQDYLIPLWSSERTSALVRQVQLPDLWIWNIQPPWLARKTGRPFPKVWSDCLRSTRNWISFFYSWLTA